MIRKFYYPQKTMIHMRITILYENSPHPDTEALIPGWGFSALIEHQDSALLFDCGWDGNAFINNCKLLCDEINPNAIIISHEHWDHVGALPVVLNHFGDIPVFLPSIFSRNQEKEIGKRVSVVKRLANFASLEEYCPKAFSTGTIRKKKGIGEQGLLLRSNNHHLTLLTGCSHPGVDLMLQAAKTLGKVNCLVGGVHGFKDIDCLKENNVDTLYLGHCTENTAILFPHAKVAEKLHVGMQILI